MLIISLIYVALYIYICVCMYMYVYKYQYVPHKAVAEVSKIGNL